MLRYYRCCRTDHYENKDAYSANVIDIEDSDVISFTVKRVNPEIPDMSVLEILAGDTSHLKDVIKII